MPTIPFHAPGVTYNGLHSTVNPTSPQVGADLATTRRHFDHVRTYYPQYGGGAVDVGRVAKDAGLSVMLGLFLFDGHPDWTEDNYQRFVKPAVARGNVSAIIIGNEDPDFVVTIKQYVKRVKADLPNVPVGTSQTIGFWSGDDRASQLLPVVDFIGVNIYPAWDWSRADGHNQPVGVTPDAGFNSFVATYNQIKGKYSGRQIVVTETGWPSTFGPIPAQQFPDGISNARDYLNRVTAWAKAEQAVVYLHNMFDDQFGVNTSSPFNYHFGLIDSGGKPKGVLF